MSSYKYASICRLTMDDPRNHHLDEGDVLLAAGRHEDGYNYTVVDDEKQGFVDVECEVLGVLEADHRMNEAQIKRWAADQDEAHELAEAAFEHTGGEQP